MNPILGNYKITELSSKKIQDFLLNKLEHGNINNNQPLSYNTIKMIYSILKNALNSAYDFEIINVDYTKKSSKSQYIITTINNGMVATRALELGMDVKSLSEILGHKSATITLNSYSHSLLNYKIEMMNKLGKNIS